MKEKRTSIPVENHSQKSIRAQVSKLPPNFNVANVARLSFGHPENLALPPMGKGKNLPVRLAPPVGRRFWNSQFNGNG